MWSISYTSSSRYISIFLSFLLGFFSCVLKIPLSQLQSFLWSIKGLHCVAFSSLVIGVGMGRLAALNTLREKLGEDGVNALLEVIEEERGGTRDNLFHLLEERSPVGLRRR